MRGVDSRDGESSNTGMYVPECHSEKLSVVSQIFGEVPERLNGAVSKIVVLLWGTVGSNPTLSASFRAVRGTTCRQGYGRPA